MKKMFIKNDDGKDIEFFPGIRFNGTFDIIKILNYERHCNIYN